MAYAAHHKGTGMSKSKAEAIVARLLTNVAGLKYGSVSVTAKIHGGRIVDVTYTVTESMKESESKEADAGETKAT
jgi:ABC-type Fe3+ transport system substrate-binding protein